MDNFFSLIPASPRALRTEAQTSSSTMIQGLRKMPVAGQQLYDPVATGQFASGYHRFCEYFARSPEKLEFNFK